VTEKDLKKQILTQEVLANISALNQFAYSLCQHREEAEELVGETVVKAFEKRHQLKDDAKIRQWLFRILNNVFISNYRKNKKQRKINLPDSVDVSFLLFEQVASSSYMDEGTPERSFINKITKEKIHQAINELPEEFRITLVLCDVDEFSYAEIAAITQVVIGTVRSRIARARNLLQKKLWTFAEELGITASQKKKEHVCTCGEEELKSANILTV
jgi:RNA polymerase sigma-70 factor (ECF subfamily)